MNINETIFHMHVDKKGLIQEGKERFECIYNSCDGDAYIEYSTVDPHGSQRLDFCCTKCGYEWTENY